MKQSGHFMKLSGHHNLTLLLVTAARQEILEQQLIFGDPLDRLDQVRCDGVLEAKLPLEGLKILPTVCHQDGRAVGLVGAILDVAVEFRRPRDKSVAHVLGHALVLLQGLEEDGLVKLKNFFNVAENGLLGTLERAWHLQS